MENSSSKLSTHCDVFVDMLRRAGYKEEAGQSQGWVGQMSFIVEKSQTIDARIEGRHFFEAGLTKVSIGRGVGYSGFCAEFYFREDGSLLVHGVWE